jgi:alkylation response protein AidB-like acyl-CoA dehydrogenase
MLAASQDFDVGGMQLPCVIEMAANAFFHKASIAMGGYTLLTAGNANLLMAHGTQLQRQVFAANEFSGRWFGTMCLSEPQAGSSLSDVATRATPDGADFEADPLGPRYRLRGNKMWISAGEHEITENIIHLVLAKIPGPDGKPLPGTRGISLFIVPKQLVNVSGDLTGERNDVALAGLNHKLGYRGTTNTLLNFGEGRFPVRGAAGAIGYLVGKPGDGLRCMFHMMNEARIGVGLGAVMLGMAGYEASLDYARSRPQGRPDRPRPARTQRRRRCPSSSTPTCAACCWRRRPTAKAAWRWSSTARAWSTNSTPAAIRRGSRRGPAAAGGADPHRQELAQRVVPGSQQLAIQVHGGYGYTRDFPVEQYWRDQRLNMIHEGTHGIQGLDLLGRKVLMDGGAGLKLLAARVNDTITRAAQVSELSQRATELAAALQSLGAATKAAWATGQPEDALANATPYLQAFGHVVLAWLWLDVALVDTDPGRRSAMRYFFAYELPRVEAWLAVVRTREAVCRDMHDSWF